MDNLLLATSLFVITYLAIISEKIHRTIVTLAGAALFLLLKIVDQHQAIESIDFNTIGLLIGMMIIVGILQQTGFFQFVAIRQAKAVKGNPWKLLLVFGIITALGSAFLDNVTTVLLLVPVTLAVTKRLQLNPIPFLITEIFMSNIGGTATLIGDPPNIMIGSALNLGFMDFIYHLTPIIIIITLVVIYLFRFIYAKELKIKDELRESLMTMNEEDYLEDKKLATKCLVVLGITIAGFVLHQFLHLESATVALSGAALLLLISGVSVEKALDGVEWTVIFFFIGLFILVGGLEKVGLIEKLARGALELTGGNIIVLSMVVLWGSGIGSAFLDNIPFVAAAIPLLQAMHSQLGSIDFTPVWWSLALGACLGGNGTLIGASANVTTAGLAEQEGINIRFSHYFKIAFPIMLLTLVISTLYIFFRYLL